MNHAKPFADRLADAVQRRRNPVMVGLDPRVDSIPNGLLDQSQRGVPGAIASAYREFCRHVIDVVAPLVAVVKPQAAFFEQLGPPGMSALADVIQYAREQDLLVILDGKRSDIGSTAEAYAAAYLSNSEWGFAADALTVSPYLGQDSLTPFVDVAVENGTGIFVLVKTSNPGGGLFQDLMSEGRPVYEHVAVHVDGLARQTVGGCGYGAIGAVVGATYPMQLEQLRKVLRHSWLLVPGFGAQGASAADVAEAFDPRGLGAIVNSSRAIIFAHQREAYRHRFGEARWQEAVEAATREMIEQLRGETPAGRLGEKNPNEDETK